MPPPSARSVYTTVSNNVLYLADGDDTALCVVATGIHALRCGTIEDLRGELEIEPALSGCFQARRCQPTPAPALSVVTT